MVPETVLTSLVSLDKAGHIHFYHKDHKPEVTHIFLPSDSQLLRAAMEVARFLGVTLSPGPSPGRVEFDIRKLNKRSTTSTDSGKDLLQCAMDNNTAGFTKPTLCEFLRILNFQKSPLGFYIFLLKDGTVKAGETTNLQKRTKQIKKEYNGGVEPELLLWLTGRGDKEFKKKFAHARVKKYGYTEVYNLLPEISSFIAAHK